MFFWIIHQLINLISPDWKESRKNCFTLFLGANLHFFFFVFLEYCGRWSNNPFYELFRRFYLVFVLIDMFTMAVIYKSYWGRTIVSEMAPDNRGWGYDEATHQYYRQDTPGYYESSYESIPENPIPENLIPEDSIPEDLTDYESMENSDETERS